MSKQLPVEGYNTDEKQRYLDELNLFISHDRNTIEQTEARIAEYKDVRETAQELAATATALMNEPRGQSTREARYDKEQAEKAIAHCTENISKLEENLTGCRNRLAASETRLKEFDHGALRARRLLDALRRRVTRS